MHDPLTGLYNRAYSQNELGRLEGGREYPVGLISVDLDALKLANAYCAMTTSRTYSRALSWEEALRELQLCAGTQFDPELVKMVAGLV